VVRKLRVKDGSWGGVGGGSQPVQWKCRGGKQKVQAFTRGWVGESGAEMQGWEPRRWGNCSTKKTRRWSEGEAGYAVKRVKSEKGAGGAGRFVREAGNSDRCVGKPKRKRTNTKSGLGKRVEKKEVGGACCDGGRRANRDWRVKSEMDLIKPGLTKKARKGLVEKEGGDPSFWG